MIGRRNLLSAIDATLEAAHHGIENPEALEALALAANELEWESQLEERPAVLAVLRFTRRRYPRAR